MITTLWRRHYFAGITGSFHGDMARAFALMLADVECDDITRRKIEQSIRHHCQLERSPTHEGRQWFCERWGTASERQAFASTEANECLR